MLNKKQDCLVLLYPLRPQLIFQSWHDLTRTMVIEPGLLVAAQPAGAAAAQRGRRVRVEMGLDQPGDQLPQLWCRQRGSPAFSPAASPSSGTTRPAARASCSSSTVKSCIFLIGNGLISSF